VQVGEQAVEKAVKASLVKQRDRRQRLLWSASTAASYALDALFIALFVASGTIAGRVLLLFVAGAAAICAATYALYASGWNLRFRDRSVILPQVAAGVALHLGMVALAPQAAFPLLANLFTVFAFGFIWLSLRGSLVMWTLSTVATGGVLWAVHGRAGIAASNAFDASITWLCFSAVLARFLVLSVFANQMRARLAEGRRKLAASLEQIRELVHYDELTKVYNRRTLIERLQQEHGRARRTGVPFCVLLIDLDHFKAVNDNFGHGAGDEVLKAFAVTMRAAMRDSDVFGRYGGEEFLAILNATAPAAAHAAIGRMRAAVEAHDWNALAPGLSLTFSGGLAGIRPEETISQLLNRADEALYEAKAAGRNRVVVKE
jgi:diguanylate cyclase (GGDEF)-like protein